MTCTIKGNWLTQSKIRWASTECAKTKSVDCECLLEENANMNIAILTVYKLFRFEIIDEVVNKL